MNAELKAKWIAALRSGKYVQGRARLRTRDGTSFCCLGVLCDISGVGEWQATRYYGPKKGDSSTVSVPTALAKRLGVYATQSGLAVMNDEGKSFAEIADYIEANL